MKDSWSIYFHAPCFDGIASAVLVADFLESERRAKVRRYRAVNYGLRNSWLRTKLDQPCAVVDFLYHPDAAFWADHHETSFLTPEALRHVEMRRGQDVIYDASAESCASLLWHYLQDRHSYKNSQYSDLVEWAKKIDGARYDSVREAIEGATPALKINATLAYGDADDYCELLVKNLRHATLEAVAEVPEVRRRYALFQRDVRIGLSRFKESARLDGGIVVFDVDAEGTIIPRYAPYYFYPHALYSVGIVRREGRISITAMRNPWLEFSGVPLGRIFERFGGGGHTRVGSLALPGLDGSRARELLATLVREIRRAARVPRGGHRAASQ